MAGAAETSDEYFSAWAKHDLDRVRGMLHDDLSFRGPIDRFENADDYMLALERLDPVFKGMEKVRVFVNGDDVLTVYDFIADPPIGTVPIAEWHQVRNGKIASIRLFFDARPFTA
jgi:SnoaL-like domain